MQWFPPSSRGCSCSPDSSQGSHGPAEQVLAPALPRCTPAPLCLHSPRHASGRGGTCFGVKTEDLSCSSLTPTAVLPEALRLRASSCWVKAGGFVGLGRETRRTDWVLRFAAMPRPCQIVLGTAAVLLQGHTNIVPNHFPCTSTYPRVCSMDRSQDILRIRGSL